MLPDHDDRRRDQDPPLPVFRGGDHGGSGDSGRFAAESSYRIKKYGIPQSLYCDHKNAFVLPREPTDAELLAGITKAKSHFGKTCDKPGVEAIAADSPQAKGRAERSHGLDHDRPAKELCLAGISTIHEASRFLLETCLPKMNGRFSRPAVGSTDARVPPGTAELKDILCFERERTVANDYAVRFECVRFKSSKPVKRCRIRRTGPPSGSGWMERWYPLERKPAPRCGVTYT